MEVAVATIDKNDGSEKIDASFMFGPPEYDDRGTYLGIKNSKIAVVGFINEFDSERLRILLKNPYQLMIDVTLDELTDDVVELLIPEDLRSRLKIFGANQLIVSCSNGKLTLTLYANDQSIEACVRPEAVVDIFEACMVY